MVLLQGGAGGRTSLAEQDSHYLVFGDTSSAVEVEFGRFCTPEH